MAFRPGTITNNLYHAFESNWSQVRIESPNCWTICVLDWEHVLRVCV